MRSHLYCTTFLKPKTSQTLGFMDSKLRVSPSYAWRGIWEIKKCLSYGCGWRVRNGKFRNIWNN